MPIPRSNPAPFITGDVQRGPTSASRSFPTKGGGTPFWPSSSSPLPSSAPPLPSTGPAYSKYDPYVPGTSPQSSSSYTPKGQAVTQPKTVSPGPLSTGNPAPYSQKPLYYPRSSSTPSIPTATPAPVPSTNPAPIPSSAPRLPMPIGAGAGAAQSARNAVSAAAGIARAGLGTSAAGAAAAAAAAIALGADPRQAVASAAGSLAGQAIGTVAGGAIGAIGGPAGMAFGAAFGGMLGSLAGGALAGGVAQSLSPTNQGTGQSVPIAMPSEPLRAEQRYTLMYDYQQRNANYVSSGFAYGTAKGSELPSLFADFAAEVQTWGDSWRLVAVYLVLVPPILSDDQAGPIIPQPQSPFGTAPSGPVLLPTDEQGNQVATSAAPSASPVPGASPVPKPGASPSLAPAPAPAQNPKEAPNLSPYPNPSPTHPAPSPFPAPAISPVLVPSLSPSKPGTAIPTSISATGTLQPQPQRQPQPPKTPSTRSRNGDCCDPIGGSSDCKFKPLEIVPVPVKTFLGCLPIPPHTPIYTTTSVSAVKGTEDQVERIFKQIAELAGSGCNPKSPPTSKVKVKLVICGQPDKANPPSGLVKQPVQQDEMGKALPPPPYHEVEVEIPCLKGLEDEVKQQYAELAEIRKAQCSLEDDEYSKKVFQILGGDEWFHRDGKGVASKTPLRFEMFDAPFRQIAKNNFEVSGKEKEKVAESHSLIEWLMNCFGVLYYRTGIHEFPTQVAETMSTYSDGEETISIYNLSSYIAWFIRQFDMLVGQFPIEIEIEDTDPATKGNQTKKVELPNLSEALAELYGVALTGSTNADLAINFLMRLSAEVIATKNSSLITQDYAKANASFLGYRGNPKQREIDYAFNPQRLDSLEEFLQNSKASIVGWSEDDKESVVGYLQRLAFSAGIIKAAFMRNSKQINRLANEMKALLANPEDEELWKKFIAEINNPESTFNSGVKEGQYPMSTLDNKPVTDGSQPNTESDKKK